MNRKNLVGTLLVATIGAIAVAVPTFKAAPLVRPANAAVEPQVIEIKAKKFEFSPSAITLKKGEPVILRLTSEDRVHGFFLKPLGIDTDVTPDKTTEVEVTPQIAGDYTVICDHYCGTGHGNMKMKLTVVE